MNDFFDDLTLQLQSYYDGLVQLTPKLLLAVVAFIFSLWIAGKIQTFTGIRLRRRMHDPLLANFISRLIRALFIAIGFVIVLRIVGLRDLFASVMAGAGISAFVIGFALKDIGENFLAGILLAFKRPFSIGDIIETNSVKGVVTALNLRDTQIRTGGKDIYIPNAILIKNLLINYTNDAYLAQEIFFHIAFGSDIENALSLIASSINTVDGVLHEKDKSVSAEVADIKTNSLAIKAVYWVRIDAGIPESTVRSNAIIKTLRILFDAGYEIPTDHLEIIQKTRPQADTSSDRRA